MGEDSDRERNNQGRYADRIDPDTVLDVFDAREDPCRPLTASDVVDALGVARRTAHNKLNALVERGVLETRKVGARGRVWWTPGPTAESPDPESVRERRVSGGEPKDSGNKADRQGSAEHSETGRDAAAAGGSATGEHSHRDAVDAALDGLETTDDRRGAVRACVEHIREHGTAQKSDFVGDVYPDHPGGFGSEGGWWNKIGKEHLQAVADDVDALASPAGEGSHTWRWVGGDATDEQRE